jgi:hypothetical protein
MNEEIVEIAEGFFLDRHIRIMRDGAKSDGLRQSLRR